jgi:hypothetical protein
MSALAAARSADRSAAPAAMVAMLTVLFAIRVEGASTAMTSKDLKAPDTRWQPITTLCFVLRDW